MDTNRQPQGYNVYNVPQHSKKDEDKVEPIVLTNALSQEEGQKLLPVTAISSSSSTGETGEMAIKGNNFYHQENQVSPLKRSSSVLVSECDRQATIGILATDLIRTTERRSFNVSIRKCSEEFPLPLGKPIMSQILGRRTHEYIRVVCLVGIWRPNVDHKSTQVSISIMDHRRSVGELDDLPLSISTNSDMLVANTVSFDSDKMYVFGMNMGTYVHKKDLSDIRVQVKMGETLTKQGRSGAKIQFFLALDESNDNILHDNCVIEPYALPREKVNLVKDFKGVIRLLTEMQKESRAATTDTKVEKFEPRTVRGI